MADTCIICDETGVKLTECRDIESFTLSKAAVAHDHQRLLEIRVDESGFPRLVVKYHRLCRARFTLKKNAKARSPEKDFNATVTGKRTRSVTGQGASSGIEDGQCIFCKKAKYKPNTRSREKLCTSAELRADEKVKTSALTHIRRSTSSSGVAEEIVGLCSSDLVAGGVKYHKSCYKLFVRISYQGKSPPDEAGRHNEQGKAEELVHKAVYEICEDIIQHPRIVEVSTIREALIDEATKQNVNLTEATKNNLLRNILSQFDNLRSLTYNNNKVLIFPTTLQEEDFVVSNYEMHQELTSLKSLSTNEIETDVIKAARLLNKEIKNYPSQMSWPLKQNNCIQAKRNCTSHLFWIHFVLCFFLGNAHRTTVAKLKEY